jgi:hypothetical protein
MRFDEKPDIHGAKLIALKFFTPIAWAWIGLTGVACVTSFCTNDRFNYGMILLTGGTSAALLGLLGGLLHNIERMAALPPERLVGRVLFVGMLCILLPAGCEFGATQGVMSAARIQGYYRDHRAELNALVELHSREPGLGISIYQGEVTQVSGKPSVVKAAQKIIDDLPYIHNFESGGVPPEIKLTLSDRSEGFFDFTRRGLVHQTKLGDYDEVLPADRDFDAIEEYDTRFVRTLEGNWQMFHEHVSD